MDFSEITEKLLTKEVLGPFILFIVLIVAFRFLKKVGGVMFYLFLLILLIVGINLFFPTLISDGVAFMKGSWMD